MVTLNYTTFLVGGFPGEGDQNDPENQQSKSQKETWMVYPGSHGKYPEMVEVPRFKKLLGAKDFCKAFPFISA